MTTTERQAENAARHQRCRAEYPDMAAREDAGVLHSYALAACDRRIAERS